METPHGHRITLSMPLQLQEPLRYFALLRSLRETTETIA